MLFEFFFESLECFFYLLWIFPLSEKLDYTDKVMHFVWSFGPAMVLQTLPASKVVG